MKSEKEKLSALLIDGAQIGETAAPLGRHLRDEDFRQLIKSKTSDAEFSAVVENNVSAVENQIAPLRAHLVNCAQCLAEFKDFYDFFAPAGENESLPSSDEIRAAWKKFAPRLDAPKQTLPGFWTRFFSTERKTNYSAAFGWSFAALLLLLAGFSIFIALQARNEKSQITAELENQKQISEARLKTLDQATQNKDLAEQEKQQLAQEKDELQKQIADLQKEIERGKQQRIPMGDLTPPTPRNSAPAATGDDSLIAVNTPIYDVFPADSAVRGESSGGNNFAVPATSKSVVLILNAAGRAEFPAYQAVLTDAAGKIIWRGAGLRKDNLGNFTITIARAALKPGNYRIKLSGKDNSAAQTVAEYMISISLK